MAAEKIEQKAKEFGLNTDYATSGVIGTSTPEEELEFKRIEQQQLLPSDVAAVRQRDIQRMAKIALECPTHSATGICTLLYDAGCRLPEK